MPVLQLQPFYSSLGPVRTTWVSWYQKGKTKTNLDFLEQETVNGSGISWALCKSVMIIQLEIESGFFDCCYAVWQQEGHPCCNVCVYVCLCYMGHVA